MDKKKLSIAIPASVVSDTPHLREKTSKLGLIARTAALFRVHEIIVYRDCQNINQKSDMNLVALLLNYSETPQYLRKSLFALKPALRYAGIIPPLRTPHHQLNRKIKNLKFGEYREGVVVSKKKDGVLVDIGIEQPTLILDRQLKKGKRVTVKIIKINGRIESKLINRKEIPGYWGYTVTVEPCSFGKMLKHRSFDLIIATSKYGALYSTAVEKIIEKWKKAETVLLAFGSPKKGLFSMVQDEGLNLDCIVDFIINTIPKQGTETVRTEEALIASLAILNARFSF
jgi:hypothetical protein